MAIINASKRSSNSLICSSSFFCIGQGPFLGFQSLALL
jgi:hypothetical protein